MVRALLDGSKTQTRRVMKPQPEATPSDYPGPAGHWWPSKAHQSMLHIENEMQKWTGLAGHACPYGQPGDRLWVRETWQYYGWSDEGEPQIRFSADNATTRPSVPIEKAGQVESAWIDLSSSANYNIDNHARDRRWRPSIHMPRWSSRILLEITGVRVERLQAITEADARAEGITDGGCTNCGNPEPCGCADPAPSARDAFCHLWGKINGAGSWDANPWVWVVAFKRVMP